MTVTISKIQKKGKLKPGKIVSQYLNLLPKILSKKERDNFIFVKGKGSLGLAFEGSVKREKKTNFSSQTVKVAGKNFSIIKYLIIDSKQALQTLASKLVKKLKSTSSFVLMEHTAKWEGYKDKKYWLDKYAPPRLTPKNNIFLPQGTVGAYFGYGEDKWGVYEKDKRGLKFVKSIKAKDYLTAVTRYYGKFLDVGNLKGFALKKETGLRHFSMGVYNRNGNPVIFQIKSENIVGKQTIINTPECQIICSHLPVAKALKDNFYKNGKLMKFPLGKVFEHRL